MRYCRFSETSDVYAYADANGDWTIWADGRLSERIGTLREFRDRLLELREQGLQVPQYAIDRANEELGKVSGIMNLILRPIVTDTTAYVFVARNGVLYCWQYDVNNKRKWVSL